MSRVILKTKLGASQADLAFAFCIDELMEVAISIASNELSVIIFLEFAQQSSAINTSRAVASNP